MLIFLLISNFYPFLPNNLPHVNTYSLPFFNKKIFNLYESFKPRRTTDQSKKILKFQKLSSSFLIETQDFPSSFSILLIPLALIQLIFTCIERKANKKDFKNSDHFLQVYLPVWCCRVFLMHQQKLEENKEISFKGYAQFEKEKKKL